MEKNDSDITSKDHDYKLGFKALLIELFKNSIWGLVIGVLLLILLSDSSLQIIAFLGVVLISLLWGWLKYVNFTYRLDGNEVIIEQGVLNKKKVSIPYKNIQNVDTSRSILERIFGLSEVKIQTAGSTSGYEGIIPNIEQSAADQIHQKISSKTK